MLLPVDEGEVVEEEVEVEFPRFLKLTMTFSFLTVVVVGVEAVERTGVFV